MNDTNTLPEPVEAALAELLHAQLLLGVATAKRRPTADAPEVLAASKALVAVCDAVRAALAQQPAAPKPIPRLIGWRSDDYLNETADPKVAKNWEPHMHLLPIFEGDPHTKLKAPEPVAQQPAASGEPAADPRWGTTLADEAMAELVEASGGCWFGGQFRITGSALCGLLRAVHEGALSSAQPAPAPADSLESLRAMLAEAVEKLTAAPPQGMALVPVALTEAMHQAGVRTIVRCTGNHDWPPRVWAAMLAAAPTAQQEPAP